MPFEDLPAEECTTSWLDTPHLEGSLPRAFEQAVYGPVTQAREGFGEYIARCDKVFGKLKKEGIDLPDGWGTGLHRRLQAVWPEQKSGPEVPDMG